MARTIDRVSQVRSNVKPYVERAMHDEELRDSLQNAWSALREVYAEVMAPRSRIAVATRLANDKEVQENLRTALDELRHAADRMQARQGGGRTARNMTLIVAGVALGVLFNPLTGPETRRWVRGRVFGGGDEFDYTSPPASGDGSTAA